MYVFWLVVCFNIAKQKSLPSSSVKLTRYHIVDKQKK